MLQNHKHKGEWWEAFPYGDHLNSLALNLYRGGIILCVRLSENEREAMLAGLEVELMENCTGDEIGDAMERADVLESRFPSQPRTLGWWEYDDCPNGQPYLHLYRDDYFSIMLPHAAGLEVVKILREFRVPVPV
jgi:hypothetical protein